MPELVAVEGGPGPAFVTALRRIWDAGDAVFPVDDRLPRPVIDRLYQAVRPTRVNDRPVDGDPVADGDALVVATSGTTGEPKGVVLTHAAVAAAAQATSRRLGIDPEADTWVCCLPVAHAGGLGVVTRALLTATPLEVLAGFDAGVVTSTALALRAGGRRPVTSLVATALGRVDAALFGIILLGGDRPPAAPPANVVVTYGMTETGGGCVYDGTPLEGVELDVRDGEVLLRGPVLGRAYRDHAGERAVAGADGWYATGDGGSIDDRGRLVVHGRLAEVIVTGGEKVWPAPVEDAIRGCAGVAEVAVVGRPDAEWGQRVVAVVVPQGDASPSLGAIREVVKQTLPPWAAPTYLELVDALPKTSLGKVKRESAFPRQPRSSDR